MGQRIFFLALAGVMLILLGAYEWEFLFGS